MVSYNFRINRFSANNPCFNCKNRVLLCHNNCEEYKKFKIENEKERFVINSNRKNEYVLNSVRQKFIAAKQQMEKNYGF